MTPTPFMLLGLPSLLQWHGTPSDWRLTPDGGLSIVAGAQTDCFIEPAGAYAKDNAPCALWTPPDPNFLLSAKVTVGFSAAFDAGTIQLRATPTLWARVCFEYLPQGQPMVVSVVTRGVSDDCNSVVIDDNELYLRVARTPRTIAFHYSRDGHYWHFVRYFSLGAVENVRVGFSAQAPTGDTCTADFSEINLCQLDLIVFQNPGFCQKPGFLSALSYCAIGCTR